MGLFRIVGAAVVAVAIGVSAPGIAAAEPITIINTSSGPTSPLQVGVDIASGLWVGTPLVDYPGTCSMLVWRTYPPQDTDDGVEGFPVSETGAALTYRVRSGRTVKLGRNCAWLRISD